MSADFPLHFTNPQDDMSFAGLSEVTSHRRSPERSEGACRARPSPACEPASRSGGENSRASLTEALGRPLAIEQQTTRCHSLVWLSLCSLLLFAGCQSTPYRYGNFHPAGGPGPAVVVVRGQPHPHLDGARDIVRSPRKLIPEQWRPLEQTTDEAEEQLLEYLEHNELTDLHVEIGHYDPAEQWRRLHGNHRIGPAWRYTVGVVSLLPYSLFPNRVFGTTRYNPFTNTLSLNSPSVPKALYEAAWAKQVRSQPVPGTYVVGSMLPGVGLLCKAQTGEDVLGYLRSREQWDLEREAYPHVYGELGAEGMGLVGYLTPMLPGPTASFAGRAVGGLAGKLIADTKAPPASRPTEPAVPEEISPDTPTGELVASARLEAEGEPAAAIADEPAVVLVRGESEAPSDRTPGRGRAGVQQAGQSDRAVTAREPTAKSPAPAVGRRRPPHAK